MAAGPTYSYSIYQSRLAYGLAQLGSRVKREYTRSMLIESSDLPGGDWRLLAERIYRTGVLGRKHEIWRRARSQGTFTAVRGFDQPKVPKWLTTKLSPVASTGDAVDLAPILLSLSLLMQRRKATMTSEGPGPAVPVAGVSDPWVHEQLFSGALEGPMSMRFIAGSVERVAFLVTCSGYGDACVPSSGGL
jgi:hypothetical protein